MRKMEFYIVHNFNLWFVFVLVVVCIFMSGSQSLRTNLFTTTSLATALP